MAQPPKVEKDGELGVTSQFAIEVQPLFIRNSFQQFFACVPSFQPKSLLFKPKWVWNNPDVIRARIVQLALDEPDLSHYTQEADIEQGFTRTGIQHASRPGRYRERNLLHLRRWDFGRSM
jgi:hypothetical protein